LRVENVYKSLSMQLWSCVWRSAMDVSTHSHGYHFLTCVTSRTCRRGSSTTLLKFVIPILYQVREECNQFWKWWNVIIKIVGKRTHNKLMINLLKCWNYVSSKYFLQIQKLLDAMFHPSRWIHFSMTPKICVTVRVEHLDWRVGISWWY
jgi:hypothetical protein